CLSYYSTYSQLTIIPSSATSTLFPYTTLFRSGNPVLFQAGSSEQGRTLAARRAEAIYSVAYDLPSAQDYYSDVKARIRRAGRERSEEHTSELQSRFDLVCRLLLVNKKINKITY